MSKMTVKALFHAVLGVLALSAQASAVAMHSPRGFPGMHGSGHLGKHTHVRPKANQHSSTITFSNPKTKGEAFPLFWCLSNSPVL